MIRLTIKEKYIVPTLEKLGYKQHPKGHHHGYIKLRGKGERWHAYWYDGNLEIHLDITIDGKHKVARLMKSLEEEHKQEILTTKDVIRREMMIPHNISKKTLARQKYMPTLSREELRKALAQIKNKSSQR